MKKFVIVMISLLVLFVFLILNYLVWDKENLIKQRDIDKIEQDWLRGQNRMLQNTVEELEQTIADLQDESHAQKARIMDLEQKLRSAEQDLQSSRKELQDASAALDLLKSLISDELKNIAANWFTGVSQNRLKESESFLDRKYTLWGNEYETEEYIDFISAIEAISIAEEQTSNEKSFAIIKNGEASAVTALIRVNADIKKDHAFKNLTNGLNTLEITFIYDYEREGWVIKSVSTHL